MTTRVFAILAIMFGISRVLIAAEPPDDHSEVLALIIRAGGNVTTESIDGQVVVDVGLSRTGATDAIVEKVATLPNLRRLFVDQTKVTNKSLSYIGKCKTLEFLSITDTQITDSGIASLKPLTKLKTVYMYGTDVSDAGIKHLASLKGLTFLNVQYTRVTKNGVRRLCKSLPAIDVYY